MKRPGTYILVIALGSDTVLDVGALGTLTFPVGTYCYVGSAMGGLDQRVSRHISKEKKVRWHIDRLTIAADSVEAFVSYPDWIPECTLASMAEGCGMVPFAPGFGCSDCKCRTHLFRTTSEDTARLIGEAGLISFSLISFPSGKPL